MAFRPLIGSFTGMKVSRFPSDPFPFSIYAALTEGLGDITMELIVARLDSGEEIYSRRNVVHLRRRRLIMSTSDPIPIPSPESEQGVITESPNCIDFYDESLGDTTVRPVRSPDLLRMRPPQRPATPPGHGSDHPQQPGPDNAAAGS